MDFYSLRELSERDGVSMATLRRWCVKGYIPGATLAAGKWFVPKNVKYRYPEPEGKRSPNYGKKSKTT